MKRKTEYMSVDDLAEKYILSNWPDDIDDLEVRNAIKFAYIDGFNDAFDYKKQKTGDKYFHFKYEDGKPIRIQ